MEEKMVARTDAMKRAEQTVEALNQSKDKYVVYKESRPITDLKQMLQTSAEMYAQNTAFMQRFEKNQPYQSITYREALEDVNGLGTALMMHGLSGKRIAVIGENCYQWATSYLAAVCGTGVVVPLDKELGAADLKQLIIEAEVSAVLFTKKFEDMFYMMKESGDTSLEMLVNLNAEEEEGGIFSWKQLKEEGKAMVKKGVRVFLDAKIDPDVMSVLLFTSGTTGIAKGVMLSQRNICEDLMSAPTLLKVYTSDIFFSFCRCIILMSAPADS